MGFKTLLKNVEKDLQRIRTTELYSGGIVLNLAFDADWFDLEETEYFRISIPCTRSQTLMMQRKHNNYIR